MSKRGLGSQQRSFDLDETQGGGGGSSSSQQQQEVQAAGDELAAPAAPSKKGRYDGLRLVRRGGQWEAERCELLTGASVSLGTFGTAEEAALASDPEKESSAAINRQLQQELIDMQFQSGRKDYELSSSTGTDLLQNFKIQSSEIQIGENIGSGGFATIHKCQWQDLDYALKMFKATDVEELRAEVQNLVLLPRHPNVVLLVGFSIQKTDGTPMLLMELLDGDLHTLVCKGEQALETRKKRRLTNVIPRLFGRDKSGLSTPIKIDFIYQIAKGMLFLHKRRVFHGDLKAKNVLVKQRPGESLQLKITDFGLSEKLMLERRKTLNKSDSHEGFDCSSFSDHSSLGVHEIRQEGNVQRVVVGNVGTVRWMAPEVYGVSGSTDMKPYSMKADVYSFSMTCVEILTGQHPFPHIESTRDVRVHVKIGGRPDLSTLKNDIPEDLLHLVKRCWNDIPESRPDFSEIYSSMLELKRAFPMD